MVLSFDSIRRHVCRIARSGEPKLYMRGVTDVFTTRSESFVKDGSAWSDAFVAATSRGDESVFLKKIIDRKSTRLNSSH